MTIKPRYLHRVPEHEAASWVARGWKVVLIEDNSTSLGTQPQRVALLEHTDDQLIDDSFSKK